jgi:hypothetical protein
VVAVLSVLDCFEDPWAIIIWERCATGNDISHVTGSDVTTGSDSCFFYYSSSTKYPLERVLHFVLHVLL